MTWINGDAPSQTRQITTTNPPLGGQFTQTVPAGLEWRILGGQFQFVTDATVINRTMRLGIFVGGNDIFRGQFSFAPIVASTTTACSYGPGLNEVGFNGRTLIAIPFARLPSGSFWSSQVIGMQAGDLFNNIRVLVEEWQV